MTMRLLSSYVACSSLALMIVLPRSATAAWPSDPTVNVPICTTPQSEEAPAMVSDGAGCSIITWRDYRPFSTGNYAQHVLASGVVDPRWPVNGVGLGGGGYAYAIVGDGSGGAIVSWDDLAQHVLASGVVDPAWPANGRALSELALEGENLLISSQTVAGVPSSPGIVLL